MSQALRKLSGSIAKSSCLVIFINQLRSSMALYGAPETTTGGKALKFYASVRIEIRRSSEKIMDGKEIIGNVTTCKVVKNKIAPPFKVAEFQMIYGEGISRSGEIIDIATNMNIIAKSGSWFSYAGERIGQGREAVKRYFEENPEIAAEIEAQVRTNSDKAKIPEDATLAEEDDVDPDDLPLDITVEDFEE